jgi:hypothetical protein
VERVDGRIDLPDRRVRRCEGLGRQSPTDVDALDAHLDALVRLASIEDAEDLFARVAGVSHVVVRAEVTLVQRAVERKVLRLRMSARDFRFAATRE